MQTFRTTTAPQLPLHQMIDYSRTVRDKTLATFTVCIDDGAYTLTGKC